MKIFLDTANLNEIKKAKALGLVDGVTTNPTLLAKEGEETETLIRKNLGSGERSCECGGHRKHP